MFLFLNYTLKSKYLREADIPEDRLKYAEAMYDVYYLNKKKRKKKG